MSWRRIRFLLPHIAALFVLFISETIVEDQLYDSTRTNTRALLESTINNTQLNVWRWIDRQKKHAGTVAELEGLGSLTEVLKVAHTAGVLGANTPELKEVRSMVARWTLSYGYLGFFIIAPDGTSLASMRDTNIGSENLIAQNAPAALKTALEGQATVTLPIRSDVPLIGATGQLQQSAPTMFVLAPIKNNNGSVVGAIALRLNPTNEFSNIFAQGRNGLSGETYAFNQAGTLITESRFNDELWSAGLLQNEQGSTLNIQVRSPSANLPQQKSKNDNYPLTIMAQSALTGKAGENLDGYSDYRGNTVVGVWRWDEELGIGLASEINQAEAYANYNTAVLVLRTFAAIVAALVIILALLQEKRRQSDAALNQSLIKAKETAEQANQSKMRFLSSMSHELRTPLNAIIGFSQTLLSSDNLKNQKQREQLEYIFSSGRHLLALIDEVLAFAKLDMGTMSFSFGRVSTAKLVNQCLSMVEDLSCNREINITLETPVESLAPLNTDETRAKQVLINLLTNAIKYNKPQGRVFLSVKAIGTQMHFEVRDTGMGLSKDKLGKLWEPFNRLGAEQSDIEGSGIGLALSKRILGALKGNISVNSVPGKGSTFSFTLPIDESEPEQEENTETGQKEIDPNSLLAGLSGLKILYVEDNLINQQLVKRMLLKAPDLNMQFALNGTDGLATLRDQSFDLILLDINLPDMSGFEFNATRLSQSISVNTPVIALTADASDEAKQKAKEMGMAGFVAKPIDYINFLTTITDTIQPEPTPASIKVAL